jgi:cobalamin biosynthesis Mg chelatase CobN
MLSDFTVTNLMATPGLEALAKKFQDEMARMKDKNMPPPPLMDVKKPVEIKPSEKNNAEDKNKDDDAKKQYNEQKDEKTKKNPDKQLKGYEMEEVHKQETSESAPIPYIYIIGFLLMIAVFYAGWRRK